MKVMSVFGTRPEAIKMCPLVKEIEKQKDMESIVCLTGQHRDMIKPILDLFQIKEDYNLDIMKQQQTLTSITADILITIEEVLKKEKPDIVLVHGDTTTSFTAALAAFYQKIPVGHVEAGLRSFDKYSPYPEEMNRMLTAKIAEIHFSPTENNRDNLKKEGITNNVFVTGNTVLDSFSYTLKENYSFQEKTLQALELEQGKWILLTAHRRENLGENMRQIFSAIRRIVTEFEMVNVIFPMHPNPAVRMVAEELLGENSRIHLIEPLEVMDMHNLMKRSYLVLTDSGGIQEEAPACAVPVLVLRTETERPEAVEAQTVKMVGVVEEDIYKATKVLLENKDIYEKMAQTANPYGDGNASSYIVSALRKWQEEKNGE